MSARAVLAISLVLGACGDNLQPIPPCEPTPPPMPARGPFADPRALPLPEGCVEGGLRDLPGRWFVTAPGQLFEFHYPKFEGTCESGFRRANWIEEDPSGQNDDYLTWSDGTIVYNRSYFYFEFKDMVFESSEVFAACLRDDGTLAGIVGYYNTDNGEMIFEVAGTKFAPKDSGAVGLELVGQLPEPAANPLYNLVVDGGYVYGAGPQGFDVIHIADPTRPRLVGHIDGAFNDVKFVRTATNVVAYAAPIYDDFTAIIDVTVPGAPVQVGSIMAYSHSLFIVPGTPPRLYFGNYSETVPVYDITNPLIPILTHSVPVAGTADVGIHDIHVAGDRIYADKTTDGVVAIDVSAGLASPVELGRVPTSYSHATWAGAAGGRPIALHGDEGMTPEDGGAFLRILDADRTSPTFMTELGRYQSQPDVGIHNIVMVGDRAYIAYYQNGIRVLDLADPSNPIEVAYYNTWDPDDSPGQPFEGALGLVLGANTIYVADNLLGLIILRIVP